MNLDRIASLLASGLKPAQVATIIGVSPSRISQISSQEDFSLLLSSKLALMEKEDIEEKTLTAKYLAAEHALINQVMEMAPIAELRDVTAALRVISERQEKMKARILPPSLTNPLTAVTVNISLPSHALQAPLVQKTLQNEIIAIGNETIAPLNAGAVISLFAKLNKDKEIENVQETSSRSSEESLSFIKEKAFLEDLSLLV